MHESSVQLTKTNQKAIAFSICSLSFQRRLRNQVTWRDPKISCLPQAAPNLKEHSEMIWQAGDRQRMPFVGSLRDSNVTLITSLPQAGGCVGEDRGFALRDCGRAHDRPACPCHRVQLQLLLPPGDRPGGDAESELQPCPELSLPAGGLRWNHFLHTRWSHWHWWGWTGSWDKRQSWVAGR